MRFMTKNEHEQPRIVFASAASGEKLRQRLELRRSSAAGKHRNKKKYHRPTERNKRDDDN
jgi:hypothetical protein